MVYLLLLVSYLPGSKSVSVRPTGYDDSRAVEIMRLTEGLLLIGTMKQMLNQKVQFYLLGYLHKRSGKSVLMLRYLRLCMN